LKIKKVDEYNFLFNHFQHLSFSLSYYFNQLFIDILGVVKRNTLFLHEIEWKNNGFLFITSNILGVQKSSELYLIQPK